MSRTGFQNVMVPVRLSSLQTDRLPTISRIYNQQSRYIGTAPVYCLFSLHFSPVNKLAVLSCLLDLWIILLSTLTESWLGDSCTLGIVFLFCKPFYWNTGSLYFILPLRLYPGLTLAMCQEPSNQLQWSGAVKLVLQLASERSIQGLLHL